MEIKQVAHYKVDIWMAGLEQHVEAVIRTVPAPEENGWVVFMHKDDEFKELRVNKAMMAAYDITPVYREK